MYDLMGRLKKRSLKPKYDHKVIRPNGPWVPSEQTDVSRTWARAREVMKGRAQELMTARAPSPRQ